MHSGLGLMDQKMAQFVSGYFADAPQGTLNSQMGWLPEHYFILKCHVEINYFDYSYMLLDVAAKWRSFCHSYCSWLPVSPFFSFRSENAVQIGVKIHTHTCWESWRFA